MIISGFAGGNKAEDLGSMITKRPLFDEFWESKRISPERIRDVPMYLTASYSCVCYSELAVRLFTDGIAVGLDCIVRVRSRHLSVCRCRESG